MASDPLATFLYHGHIGVQLFFVISGFIIALPFARGYSGNGKPPQLRQYFLRRLTRLEPPYILNLFVYFLIVPIATGISSKGLVPHLFASMAYLHNIIYGKASAVNFVAWSLEVELQFYVLAPISTLLFKLRSRLVRRGLIVALILFFSIMSYLIDDSPRYNLSILSMAQYFLTGFLLVDIYLSDWNESPARSYFYDMVSIMSWIAICLLPYKDKTGGLFIVVPMFLAYYSAFRGILSSRFFCKPAIYTIGGMCYTLYLYHFFVISVFVRLLDKLGVLHQAPLWLLIIAVSLVVIPVILVSSTFMFILVERPCMKKDWYLGLCGHVRWAYKAARLSMAGRRG